LAEEPITTCPIVFPATSLTGTTFPGLVGQLMELNRPNLFHRIHHGCFCIGN
jgi:hypothetical protein